MLSRNPRAKSLKVKHALKIFVLVAICVWFLYHFKHSHRMKIGVLKIGRKQVQPQVDIEVGGEEEVELMEKVGEHDGEEMDEGEKEKSEEVQAQVEVEHDQMQDFIDEDDKDQLLVEV